MVVVVVEVVVMTIDCNDDGEYDNDDKTLSGANSRRDSGIEGASGKSCHRCWIYPA